MKPRLRKPWRSSSRRQGWFCRRAKAVTFATVLPDLAHYVFWQPDVLSLSFAVRHLVNPFRTLANWRVVEGQAWFVIPFAMGAAGAIAYVLLLLLGMRATGQPAPVRAPGAPPVTEEAGRANVLY